MGCQAGLGAVRVVFEGGFLNRVILESANVNMAADRASSAAKQVIECGRERDAFFILGCRRQRVKRRWQLKGRGEEK